MTPRRKRRHERGAGLFLALLIAAFLGAIGTTLLFLTGIGPKISSGMRNQEEAFNAAEAGFDAAKALIENNFATGTWTSFAGHTRSQPEGIDRPFISGGVNPSYFRRVSDEDLLARLAAGGAGTGLVYSERTFATDETGGIDLRLTYTAFLIDDEAGGPVSDPSDALLVVIGVIRAGQRILTTSRLEIVLAYTAPGTRG